MAENSIRFTSEPRRVLIQVTRCVLLETVSDWLKVLIKETNVPFLVVSIEGRVEQILQAKSQLSRLFAVRERLEPFQWNPADETTLKEFASLATYHFGAAASKSHLELVER